MTVLIDATSLWVAATNCYVAAVGTGRPAVIIDAPPDPEGIGALCRRHQLSPVALLLTHGHIDHMGGAGSLGITAYVHPDDDYLTLRPEDQLRSLFGMMPPGDFAPPRRFEALEDGMALDLAGLTFEVRHTPGHTPGHCCFFVASEGVLFSGDQLFAGSIGRTDLPGGSLPQLIESMRTKVLSLPDEVRVLPGHGPETTIGRERRANPFLIG
jgi:glyoxylase-like metal-dependent hydrolase (beta-lactamase superfamily II)